MCVYVLNKLKLQSEARNQYHFTAEKIYEVRLFVAKQHGFQLLKSKETLDSNDRNQFTDQRFLLKEWFATGAHSCRLRKTGSAYCYLRISEIEWHCDRYPQDIEKPAIKVPQ